jgi:DNA adenine methylase
MESSPNTAPAEALTSIAPTRPAAGYVGGKRNLARRLVARINDVPHDCYVEGFVGMGGVFFRRDRRPPAEVINDLSEDVTTFFRILQPTMWRSWTCCASRSPAAPASIA